MAKMKRDAAAKRKRRTRKPYCKRPLGIAFRSDAVRELMARDGLDFYGFVHKSRFSRQLVSAWMGGGTCPRFDTLVLLCNRFNVMPEFFAVGLTVNATRAATHAADDTGAAPAKRRRR